MSTNTKLPASLRYDEVNVGDELPTLEIPLTRTLIGLEIVVAPLLSMAAARRL